MLNVEEDKKSVFVGVKSRIVRNYERSPYQRSAKNVVTEWSCLASNLVNQLLLAPDTLRVVAYKTVCTLDKISNVSLSYRSQGINDILYSEHPFHFFSFPQPTVMEFLLINIHWITQ